MFLWGTVGSLWGAMGQALTCRRRLAVRQMAQTNIPPIPTSCRVRRPERSTRNSWGGNGESVGGKWGAMGGQWGAVGGEMGGLWGGNGVLWGVSGQWVVYGGLWEGKWGATGGQ